MKSTFSRRWFRTSLLSLGFCSVAIPAGWAADSPSAKDALKLEPIQKGVVFDTPSEAEQEKCNVRSVSEDGERGWIVLDGDGVVLRSFLDTNGDNKLDRWCYYQNGVEVYRDIDDNFNGKADQYRWLGTAGIRWGIDSDEDGTIDSWKMISAEEVTAEIVEAIRQGDLDRFERVLMTETELKALGLGDRQQEEIAKKLSTAKEDFNTFAKEQTTVESSTKWLHFGGTRPGLIPAGTDGSENDLIVYDNVAAIVENDGQHGQLSIGTLIRVGDRWRAIELPEMSIRGQANNNGGMFYQASVAASLDDSSSTAPSAGVSEESQKLLEKYDEIDRQIATATNASTLAKLNGERAELLAQLAFASTQSENQMNWVRQFADTVSGSFQTGEYPGGLKRLADFERTLRQKKFDKDAIAYVSYRYMNAKYTQDIQQEDADLQKIQETWLQNLAGFVKEHPTNEQAPDAIMQLALAEEFAGAEEKAIVWYQKINASFPNSPYAAKAQGAVRRLKSVGQSVRIQGTSLDGQKVDTARLANKVVVVHYWASWCQLCKEDFTVLKNLQAKYGRSGLVIIGINLDTTSQPAKQYLSSAPLPWPQLHEEGGLDGRLANEMGILTLPTMLLIDKQGRVIRRDVTAAELDGELKKQIQ